MAREARVEQEAQRCQGSWTQTILEALFIAFWQLTPVLATEPQIKEKVSFAFVAQEGRHN